MNKYSIYSNKAENDVCQIVLARGVELPNNEELKANFQRRPRAFLLLHNFNTGHYLALRISNKFKDEPSQYLIPKEVCLATNFLTDIAYVTCNQIYEIEDYQIIKNSAPIPRKLFTQIINYTMKNYALGFYTGKEEHLKIIHDMYSKNKITTIGNVIKVPYNNNYLLIYDETDKEFICLPLYLEEQENTQDVIQVLRRRSYVNYDEKFYVPKNDMIYIERFGDANTMRIIEQIKNPEEALELSMFYFKKD